MYIAQLEDRCRELESIIAYRESELFEARRQVAALRAQSWQPVEDGWYASGCITVDDDGTYIGIKDRDADGLKSYLGTMMPFDLRLCYRTQPDPVQS